MDKKTNEELKKLVDQAVAGDKDALETVILSRSEEHTSELQSQR